MGTKITVKAVFLYLTALLLLFMFKNGDSYFNINEYRNILFLTVAIGLIQVPISVIKISKGKIVPSILILLCISFMLCSKYIIGVHSEPYYILFITILYLFMLCMVTINFNAKQITFLIKSYIVSATIISLLVLIQHRTPYSGYGIFRMALYYSSDRYYDVNFTAMYLIVPTLLAFKISTKAINLRERAIALFCVGINMLAVLMLGSRGAFAPIVAIIILEVLRDKKVSFSKIFIILIGLIAIFFLLPQDILLRLLGGNYINMESKRIEDWRLGIEVFKQSPWVGNGMMSPKELVKRVAGVDWYTIHNTYIVYLAQLGIIGALPFFGILLYPLKKLWNGIKHPFLFLTYCGVLFAAMMIESNYSYVLIVPISIFYAIINYSQNGEKIESIIDSFY